MNSKPSGEAGGGRSEDERARLFALERAARADAEEAQRRLQFLLDTSTVLSATLDYERALIELAELTAGALADLCLVDVLEPSGAIRRMAAVHADPSRQKLASRLIERPPDPGGSHPAAIAMRTGQPQFSPQMDDELLRATTRDEEHFQIARQLGCESYMSVPLVARGRILGTISFVSTSPGRRFGEVDLAMATELARRAALAVDNARLYGERSRVAKTLQASLLPPHLPLIDWLQVAARYQAAAEGADVGGDFYDLFRTARDDWTIVIGDVCGKGADAAAITALARYTLRAAAMQARKPSRILGLLNQALLREAGDCSYCTVACLRLRRTPSGIRASLASGGHPLPLLLRDDEGVQPIGRPGHPLGMFPEPALRDQNVRLAPGDALLLYTDGVTEARGPSGPVGETGLRDLLRRARDPSPDPLLDGILHGLRDMGVGPIRDDIALLALRVATPG